jgi:hypothetical protein
MQSSACGGGIIQLLNHTGKCAQTPILRKAGSTVSPVSLIMRADQGRCRDAYTQTPGYSKPPDDPHPIPRARLIVRLHEARQASAGIASAAKFCRSPVLTIQVEARGAARHRS